MKLVMTLFKMSIIEDLEKILKEINNAGGVETSVIASRDGLLICSTLSRKQHPETFVAMCATMMGAAETAAIVLGNGIPERIIVETKDGKIIGTGVGPKALLIVISKPHADLGLILLEIKKSSDKIKKILG